MDIQEILKSSKTIAVVGLSPNEERPSNKVARYLQSVGYKIIPVNPGQKEILGEACYKSLKAIPQKIDIVDIFRRSEDVPPLVDDAIEIGAKVIWMQEGIAVSEDAAQKARAAGIVVIMERCILKEHQRVKEL